MSRTNKYVCIHGHFYQPPRENAWLETVEQQESASPWHDWNERINFECYAPNAAARILDEKGWIVKIRNNYNRISFNFGPTLLSWLETNDPDAYHLILKSDKRSAERFGGHGSAMAQVHSHLILPLANYRDKVTQVFWGAKDFEYRFGRYPEGIWLSETAVNTEALEVLASHGLQFTILAPRQAKAVRKSGEAIWTSVNAENLDTRRPYWVVLPSGRRIAIFFYDGKTAQEVAFNGLLNSGRAFAKRLVSVFDENNAPQISQIATDGESYGHHHRFGEMALADALNFIEDNNLATLTNYGQFLELFPPEYEAQIHENSSWSCVHGVERWRSDCGCCSGTNPGWHQRWRKPLRETLDWLRDRLAPIFENEAGRFLRDPWAARNDFIEIMLDRSEARTQVFLKRHARRALSNLEETTVLRLLEMQRHAMLMYTSCGWFFDEISGIETNQILQYALRAMDYAHDVSGIELHGEFTKRLADAPSNKYQNGAASYLQNVVPTKVNLERVAMHFAVASVFETDPEKLDLFNYTISLEDFQKIEAGKSRFATGWIKTRSRLTHHEKSFGLAVLYLGQQHIIGNVSAKMNRAKFEEMATRTLKSFREAHLGEVIGALQEYFGPEKFTLASLFADERIKIIRDITEQNFEAAEVGFRNVYNENYQLMLAFQESGLPLPEAWRNIASYVLNANLKKYFKNGLAPDIAPLRRVADDIARWKVNISDEETMKHAASAFFFREILNLKNEDVPVQKINWICETLEIVNELRLKPDIWRSQNEFYLATKGHRKENWVFISEAWQKAFERLAGLLKVRI